jgi:hypothetical protein
MVTAPLSEDGLSELMPTVMPVVGEEVIVAAASPILRVKVLANVLVRVVVWALAVMMAVYEEVKTENSAVLTEGGGVERLAFVVEAVVTKPAVWAAAFVGQVGVSWELNESSSPQR